MESSCQQGSSEEISATCAGATPAESVRSRVVEIPRGGCVPRELAKAWRACVQGTPQPSSPFLDPAFVEAVATGRDDVQVLVGYDGEVPVAFLPLHRVGRSRAVAVGQRLSDVQGPVVAPGASVDVAGLLFGAGIHSWHFRRVAEGAGIHDRFRWRRLNSYVVEVDADFDAYRAGRKAAGSRRIEQGLRKWRKLGREVGDVRFEFDSPSKDTLEVLLRWKAAQRARTGSFNAFEVPWARAVVHALHDRQTADFGGCLSAVWAGDELVAAHFGPTGPGILHWWIPSYDPRFAEYSPGLVLVVGLLRAAADAGNAALDLGYGDESYKASLATRTYGLDAGAIEKSDLRRRAGRAAMGLRESVRSSPLETGWHATKQLVRRARRLVS